MTEANSSRSQAVFPVGELSAAVCTAGMALLVALAFSGCQRAVRRPDIENMSGEGSKSLTPGLAVHKTSATTYDLCDRDGVGVLNGSVIGIRQLTEGSFLIAYVAFDRLPDSLDKVNAQDVRMAVVRTKPDGALTPDGVHLLPNGTTKLPTGEDLNIGDYTPIEDWWRTPAVR